MWLKVTGKGQGCVAVWYLTPYFGYFILPPLWKGLTNATSKDVCVVPKHQTAKWCYQFAGHGLKRERKPVPLCQEDAFFLLRMRHPLFLSGTSGSFCKFKFPFFFLIQFKFFLNYLFVPYSLSTYLSSFYFSSMVCPDGKVYYPVGFLQFSNFLFCFVYLFFFTITVSGRD